MVDECTDAEIRISPLRQLKIPVLFHKGETASHDRKNVFDKDAIIIFNACTSTTTNIHNKHLNRMIQMSSDPTEKP